MLATVRPITALILREMATTYGRSPGGYVWAVLEPLAGIALLSLVLSLAFVAPPLGSSFPLFYATGLIPFLFYNDVSTKVGQSINFSRPLLRYPSVTFLDAILARFVINFLVQLLVAYLLLYSILMFARDAGWPDFAHLGLAFGMIGTLALGVGVLNCFLLTRFPIWQRLWGIANRPLFIVSCIFFTFEGVPEKFQHFLWWNPIVHLTGQMRMAVFEGYRPDYLSPTYVFGLSLILMVLGLIFLRRHHRALVAA